MQNVILNINNHIAEVILNRPEKLNALNKDLLQELIVVGKTVADNEAIRAVVLRGEGNAFCSGLDTSSFSFDNSELNEDLTVRTHGITNKWQQAVWCWRACPVPVIAAAHGFVFGGGLQILSGTDIKYLHPETQLSIMEMRWGIVPDMAGTQLWRHNVREDILKELTFTNRKFSAKEAVDYGFATYLSENPVEAAFELAETISKKSPTAIVKAKQLINNMNYNSAENGLLEESKAQEQILRKHNNVEAIFSYMQKREANFKPFRESETSKT